MGLLDMIQKDPEKRAALSQGILEMGIQMLAGGRQDFGSSLGQGLGAGVGAYNYQRELYKKEAEKAKQKQAQSQAIQAATLPGRPAIPAQYKVGGNPYATREAAQSAAMPNENTQLMAESMGSQVQPQSIEEVPGQEAQAGGFDFSKFVQSTMMNPDSPDREMALQYMASQKDRAEGRTAEQKNWEFAQSLPEDQRQQFMGASNKGSTPSTIQEFEYLKKLEAEGDTAGIDRFFEIKRAQQWRDMGGYQAPVKAGGGLGPAVAKTPSPDTLINNERSMREGDLNREAAQRTQDLNNLKMGEAQLKQANGVKNLQNAVTEYTAALQSWNKGDVLSPDARAAMGTKYNNMMLQAKEAYNLGVLNGPDFDILQRVVTDPRTIMGTITSNKALENQATELSRIMGGVGAVVAAPNRQRGAESRGESVTPEQAKLIQQRRAAGVSDAEIAKELTAGARKASKPAAIPKFGEVRGGYTFIGGNKANPNDPKNWKKVAP